MTFPGNAPSQSSNPQDNDASAKSLLDLHKEIEKQQEELSRVTGMGNRNHFYKNYVEPLEDAVDSHPVTEQVAQANRENYDDGMSFSIEQRSFLEDFYNLVTSGVFSRYEAEIGQSGPGRGHFDSSDRAKVVAIRKFFEDYDNNEEEEEGYFKQDTFSEMKAEFERLFPRSAEEQN